MPNADLLLHNANVITMDSSRPAARLVAVKGDKILLAGDEDLLGEVRGAGTKVIDCRGKTVVPGFNDAHCHLLSYIRKLRGLYLSPDSVKSIADIKLADLAVLSADPLQSPPQDLKDIRVEKTIIGGEVVWGD